MSETATFVTEQALLGCLLIDREAFDRMGAPIGARDFENQAHRFIFQAISNLQAQMKPVDVLTVVETLEQAERLSHAGGVEYLVTLREAAVSAANVASYARTIRRKSMLRRQQKAAAAITEIFDHSEDPELALAQAEEIFAKINQRTVEGGAQRVGELIEPVIENIQKAMEAEDGVTGLSTGYADLDQQTAGLQPGDAIIVAGRPSMGKTAFSLNIAEYVAVRQEKPVFVWSLEMPKTQLVLRMMASMGGVNMQSLRRGQLAPEDWDKLSVATNKLKDAPLFIEDNSYLTLPQLRAQLRRQQRETGLSLMVVDYLQLIQCPGESETQRIGNASIGLKAIAKEFNIPVIILSQLNRDVEKRPNKRPNLSDLRGSGQVEQDADVAMFIYRDQVYNPDSPDKGTAEIIISKQRNGPLGTVRLTFLGEHTRFTNYTGKQGDGDCDYNKPKPKGYEG